MTLAGLLNGRTSGRVTTSRVQQSVVVLALAAGTFLPALHNGLLGDDSILLEQRLDSARAPNLPILFQQDYWGDLHRSGLYRPLTLTLLHVQRRAFGLDPIPYRIVSLLLHGVCTILVLQLLRRLVRPRAAVAGAVLFAVHPIHAEAVITIYGQADLWCALFILASLNCDSWPQPTSRRYVNLGWAAVFYLLSLFCKEQSALLVALLFFPGRDGDWHPPEGAVQHRNTRMFVLLVPLVVYSALRMQALGAEMVPAGMSSVASGYPWWARVNLIIVTVGMYLRLLVVPWGQTTYYGHLREALFGTPVMEIAVLVLAGISFGPLQRVLGRALVSRAAVILALTLLPVSNLIPIGMVVGERCLYLPSVGVCLLGAAAYARLETKRVKAAAAVVSIAAAIGIVLSVRVASRWQTPLKHWETTTADHPGSAGAHARLALVLLKDIADSHGGLDDPRIARTEDALRRALEINPKDPRGVGRQRLAGAHEARLSRRGRRIPASCVTSPGQHGYRSAAAAV